MFKRLLSRLVMGGFEGSLRRKLIMRMFEEEAEYWILEMLRRLIRECLMRMRLIMCSMRGC